MNVNTTFRRHVAEWHAWKNELVGIQALALAFSWVAIMAILAQVRFVLPFTPVPFTMQVFGVLLGGIVLGRGLSTLAQGLYVGLGILGMQWFQGTNGGWEYFLGPTGGYLLSYPLATFLVATLAEQGRGRPVRALTAMLVGLATIYAFGVVWLAFVIDVSFLDAIMLGAVPFVVLDLVKAVLATGVGLGVASR